MVAEVQCHRIPWGMFALSALCARACTNSPSSHRPLLGRRPAFGDAVCARSLPREREREDEQERDREKGGEGERHRHNNGSGGGFITTAAAMGTSWSWTGSPARHRRPGEDRRGGCACSTVVRSGTALESSYHRWHCSPKRRLAKGGGMREFTTRFSTACASVRMRFKEMAPFFFPSP